MFVRLDEVTKKFNDTVAVNRVSLRIEDGELFFLLGPSGCGKTTLLRLLAGFYQPDSGHIYFGNKLMDTVPAERRNTGMVFQNYALWPHMTVEQNVAYGLDVRKVPAAEKKARVREALEIVRMNDYAQRRPNQLSGGQQQRVALARAIVIRPDLLLLDEPLSNLDARLRMTLRDEIRRIHAETRITTIYVTHDQSEALSLARHIAVLREGHLEQKGTPLELYRQPNSVFNANFMGEINWFEGNVESVNDRIILVRVNDFLWKVRAAGSYTPGTAVKIGFRPETVSLVPVETSDVNELEASVTDTLYLGAMRETLFRPKIFPNKILKSLDLNPNTSLSIQNTYTLYILPGDILIFPSDK
ncbi:MAG: ABC transporter ATP-binding protein [Verrucomicrobia bacterium]|nr:ABC transporter ATP-binding protein [Verrucomicrobiota bacterium]